MHGVCISRARCFGWAAVEIDGLCLACRIPFIMVVSSRSFGHAVSSILLGAMVGLVATTASAELLGTQPGDVPAEGFVDADYCGQCHGGGIDGDYSYLPTDTWAGTMMANAARDPVFLAALTIANQDEPGVGTYCLRCHAPLGFVREHASSPDGSLLDDVDKQGVGCEVCHRATQSSGASAPYLLSDAQLVFTADTAKHGPYEGALSPVHDTVEDKGLSDSRFCGQCHFVTNPGRHLRNAQGLETQLDFPLDTTFVEWANSSYADAASANHASCQDCHMKPKSGKFLVSDDATAPLRMNPPRHEFVGGNVWGIDAVMAANPDRAMTYGIAFSNARTKAEANLRNAVTLTVLAAPERIRAGEMLEVKARIENRTGHKFPTGYAESRRAWVSLMLVDADLVKHPLVGAYDEETGDIAMDPPTHVYRARHGRFEGNVALEEEHLARHDMILSDTRIPPLGFVATETTMPTAEIDYSDGMGGYRNTDEIVLRAKVPLQLSGHQALVVQVQYQSMTRAHVEMLAKENVTDSRGAELLAIYETTQRAPPLAVATMMQGIEVDSAANGDSIDDSAACALVAGKQNASSAVLLGLAFAAMRMRKRWAARQEWCRIRNLV